MTDKDNLQARKISYRPGDFSRALLELDKKGTSEMSEGNCPHGWRYKEVVSDSTAPSYNKRYRAHDGCAIQINQAVSATEKPIRIYTPRREKVNGTDG